MIERPDADTLLAGPLGVWLDVRARLRTDTAARAQGRFFWGVGLAAALAFAVILYNGAVVIALQIGFAVGALGYGWSEWTRRKVVAQIKAGINSAIGDALGVRYSPVVTEARLFEAAQAWELLPRFDEAKCEDQWLGDVGGRPFCLHELKLAQKRGSGENRRKVTVYSGSLIRIEFARRFSGTTVIERKGWKRGPGGGLLGSKLLGGKLLGGLLGGDRDAITVNGQRLGRIDLVDPCFGDLFDVWSNDPVEGHYLVNPAYVERLVAIEQAFAGDKLRALFNGGDLLIALECGDLFESGSLDARDDRRLVQQSITQFATLADLAIGLNARAR